jgi:preprotein translocase subunit SecE
MKSTPKPPTRPATKPVAGRPVTKAARARNSAAAQEFFRGMVSEMKRVTWPSREEWVAATILTVVLVVGVGVFTYLVDLAFAEIFKLLTGGAR